ncbi:SpoIIE family protein phosphatase [Streptomyces regalis]|uniref:SpoIIE family protein phosphatase n=1 Tax=Streptomyces regalis TaxID=68262 RepID=UPI000B099BFF|nr:SpoIIE family protein phosphatase [Streptomyces regalis]
MGAESRLAGATSRAPAVKGRAERTRILHRSVRVTLAASVGFYTCVYGLEEPVPALYALFAPISVGLLSPIPGSGRQRAEVMLKALPVGLLLVALGTVLAVTTWAAVLGMLVVGFLLAFAAIAGPRPAGAAPGLQLFYILACFPPYEPETLGLRLAGLIFGVVVLALCELFLLPQPPDPTYRRALADALVTAGDTVAGSTVLSAEALREAGARLRLSHIPPAERPAGPGRAVRGLSQAGAAVRRLLEQLAHLTETGEFRVLVRGGGRTATAAGPLLPQVVSLCEETAAALRTGRAAPGPQRMDKAIDDFQQIRVRQVTGATDGVSEARNEGGVFYPVLERLGERFCGEGALDPETVVSFVRADAERWSARSDNDDRAVLALTVEAVAPT